MMRLYYNFKKIKFLIKDSYGGVCLQIQSWEDKSEGTLGLTGKPAQPTWIFPGQPETLFPKTSLLQQVSLKDDA